MRYITSDIYVYSTSMIRLDRSQNDRGTGEVKVVVADWAYSARDRLQNNRQPNSQTGAKRARNGSFEGP